LPGTTYNIIVLGDSAAWGQGLPPDEKFHSLVAAAIRARNPAVTVPAPVLRAHSGATIFFRPPSAPVLSLTGEMAGEIPTPYPTIVEQCNSFTGPPDPRDIDLVLVNGGINDVELTTILNPYTTTTTVATLVRDRCYTPWKETLFPALLTKFPNARIVVIGYYPIVSALTSLARLEALCVAIWAPLPWFVLIAGSIFLDWMKQQVVANCWMFARGSANMMYWAAAETSDAWNRPIDFADPYIGGFGETHSIFTDDPWLFGAAGTIPFIAPEDTVPRQSTCAQAFPTDAANRAICNLASAGHPNPRGARAYADAILAVLFAPHLTVRVTPSPVPLGVSTSVVVSAEDFVTHAPVAGTVRIRNFDAFRRPVYLQSTTGTPVTATFRQGTIRQFDPETRRWISEPVDPAGALSATGYPMADVPFAWA
jgi:lysophospholipase L1-like esterase